MELDLCSILFIKYRCSDVFYIMCDFRVLALEEGTGPEYLDSDLLAKHRQAKADLEKNLQQGRYAAYVDYSNVWEYEKLHVS